jgi:hypothetical protein
MLDEFTIKRLVANKKELEGYFIEEGIRKLLYRS